MDSKRNTRVEINISGQIFETFFGTLERFPDTLLGNKNKRLPHYCPHNKQFFFDRNRFCFESILHFYQSNGTLSCPVGVSIALFEQECRYFCLPKRFINAMKLKEGIFPDLMEENTDEDAPDTFKSRLWNILEEPRDSKLGWNLGITSLFFVLASTIVAVLETMTTLKSEAYVLSLIELSLNIWFLVELFFRVTFCPQVMQFMRGYMNVIDIVAVTPYFFILAVQGNMSDGMMKEHVIQFLQTLKFIRVCRLFRFSHQSRRLKVAGKILATCVGDFRMLILCMFIVITLGGTFMYSCEETKLGTNHFESIPASLWWSVQTITSVGYGDLVPRSLVGRLFAVTYMCLGVATIALPILTIVSQFVRLYPKNIEMESQQGQEQLGGTNNDGQVSLLRGLKPVRPPSNHHR